MDPVIAFYGIFILMKTSGAKNSAKSKASGDSEAIKQKEQYATNIKALLKQRHIHAIIAFFILIEDRSDRLILLYV